MDEPAGDPTPPPPELRAGDADRERAADLLRAAAGEGRLSVEELDERLAGAYASTTRRELEALVADVVPGPAGQALDAPASRRVAVRRGEGGSRWIVAVMGGNDRTGRWRLARRCTVLNVMGGSDLDLNDVELADDHVTLTVISIMGGSDIYVPPGLHVEVSRFALMGGNDVDLGDDRPDPSAPVLRVRALSIMGGTDVRRGRRRRRAERGT